jgi:hypothetical protein
MNVEKLQAKLLTAARALPPAERVPYAFEKRIMAALAALPAPDPWALWSHLLWRAAAPCVGIMLAVSIWAMFFPSTGSASATLAADLEGTLWGPLVALNDTW